MNTLCIQIDMNTSRHITMPQTSHMLQTTNAWPMQRQRDLDPWRLQGSSSSTTNADEPSNHTRPPHNFLQGTQETWRASYRVAIVTEVAQLPLFLCRNR